MTNWKKQTVPGKKLRALVEKATTKEGCVAVVLELRELCEIFQKYKGFEDLYNLLDGDDDFIMSNKDEDWEDLGWTGYQDLTQCRLDEFFDLCDDACLWVS